MMRQDRDQAGEMLVEVVISIVIIGLVIAAFFSAITTTSTATTSQRNYVTGDAMLRDSAELTKDAVRRDCSTVSTYTVLYSSLPTHTGFTYPADVLNAPCPPVTASFSATEVPTVTLTVTEPGGHSKSLLIMVRTP